MRGVDLDVFDFDYDATWMALFLSADEKVHGRYGGHHPVAPQKNLSLAGLRHALTEALTAHRREPPRLEPAPPRAPRTAEQYPAAKQLSARACIHCHNVYDFRREALQAAGKWRLDEVWAYPLPENVGLALDVHR